MLSVRLPEDLEKRLNFLAKKTNRTKSFYALEALRRHLEDMEDLYLAEKAHEDFIVSGEKALTTEDVEKALGL
ncbi:MAG: TraY domain-containing protein [Desulfobacteraceae bacterium]|nr:TraY domain-containing protein [Desulfobacteraceae bacterium]